MSPRAGLSGKGGSHDPQHRPALCAPPLQHHRNPLLAMGALCDLCPRGRCGCRGLGDAVVSLLSNIHFRAWVANAVHAVSGIWPLDWQGSQRKRALTCEEIRMAACQEEMADSFHVLFSDSARASQLGAADNGGRGQMLH